MVQKTRQSGIQQLELLAEEAPETLVEETRQLFNHDGSDADLLKQVLLAIHTLQDLEAEPEESVA